MITLSHLLWRTILAGLGFAAAIVTTVVVGTLGLAAIASAHREVVAADPGTMVPVLGMMMRGGLLLPVFSTIVWPAWLVAVVLGEVTGARSLLLHLTVATAIAVVGVMGGAPVLGPAQLRLIAAVGLSAGFAHWLVAGRSAGIRRPLPMRGAPRPPHDGAREDAISERDPVP